jgi:hypothetical protein
MSKSKYMPRPYKDRVVWFMNFNAVFATVATTLGFTAAEIAAVNADYLAAKYIMDMLEMFKAEMLERTSFKDILFDGDPGVVLTEMPVGPVLPVAPEVVQPGIFSRVSKVVQRIKNHPGYNNSIGRNLGIIGPEKNVDLLTIKPVIGLKAVTSNSVIIDFNKGEMEGVVVFSGSPVVVAPEENTNQTPGNESEAEINWTEIARVIHAPFVDNRVNTLNKPETRYYKMQYLKHDKVVGQESDIIRVISTVGKSGADLANKLK